jgi:dihydrofolate reductase
MRTLIAGTMLTLNGSWTNQGTWTAGFFDEEAKSNATASLAEADLFLLGRRTYEQFAPKWSAIRGDPYFDAMNAKRKAVCSNTLSDATWNATVLRGDAVENVRRLKTEPGAQIVTYGVTSLTRALLAAGLVDELRFWIHPIVADGARVFEDLDASRLRLELTSTSRYRSGVVQVTYRPHAA